MFALNQGRNDWYRIRNQIDGPTQVHIYDEIGYFGVSASDLVRDLADVNGPIEVHINSPGGEVFDGITIYNALHARKDVTIMIDGLAASIASVVAMAGNPVLIARQATLMVHQPFSMAIGNSTDFREHADNLDRQQNNLAAIYSEHTGKPAEYWHQIMKAETWYSAQEAIDNGLCDRFIDTGAGRPVVPPGENWNMGVFRGSGPRGAASVPYVGERQARHEPMTGSHTHDHGAHGHPDADDGVHEHQHSHDGDASHDHMHQSGTTAQLVHGMPVAHFDRGKYDDSAWEPSVPWLSCHDAGDFRLVALERTTGSPTTREHWELAHHRTPGAPPSRQGVENALARAGSITDLVDRAAALAHLQEHVKAWKGESNSNVAGFEDLDDEFFAGISNALKGART